MKKFETEPGRCKDCRIALKKEYKKKRMMRRKKYSNNKTSENANDGGADENDVEN